MIRRMKTRTFATAALLLIGFIVQLAQAADKFVVTATNDLTIARPDETIVIPFAEVKSRLPDVMFGQVVVRDRNGKIIPSQVTAFVHSHKGEQPYNELIFQHSFAAGEKSARFTIWKSATAVGPYESKIYLRYVQERFDDFAWENDRIGHRIYGPGLELPSAGKDQMTSSGIDLWTKKVRYPVIDRWYRKGHDGLHTDTGEGLDMYEVGMNRGAGGTGIWNGTALATSKNWRTWKILANGPVRGVFELGYEPWDAGGVMVSETKRFVLDAGHQLNEVQSTFTFTSGAEKSLVAAIGLSQHTTLATVAGFHNEQGRYAGLWEEYKDEGDGNLGVAALLAPSANFAGFAELPATPGVPRLVRPELLVLANVRSGEPLHYFIGGAWNKAGDIKSRAEWENYLAAWAKRVASPLKLSYSS